MRFFILVTALFAAMTMNQLACAKDPKIKDCNLRTVEWPPEGFFQQTRRWADVSKIWSFCSTGNEPSWYGIVFGYELDNLKDESLDSRKVRDTMRSVYRSDSFPFPVDDIKPVARQVRCDDFGGRNPGEPYQVGGHLVHRCMVPPGGVSGGRDLRVHFVRIGWIVPDHGGRNGKPIVLILAAWLTMIVESSEDFHTLQRRMRESYSDVNAATNGNGTLAEGWIMSSP